jgi:hypothetical protein
VLARPYIGCVPHRLFSVKDAHTRSLGLAMSIGVLLLAVGSYLSGKDHGIGSILTNAIKAALQQASGAAK